jgi:hypothetical protein
MIKYFESKFPNRARFNELVKELSFGELDYYTRSYANMTEDYEYIDETKDEHVHSIIMREIREKKNAEQRKLG